LIIDGPGLAYHAYYKALVRRNHCRNALEALPSYEEVTAVAIEWLQTIHKYAFKLDAIYFDGALPHHKRQVRVERLQLYLSQLSSFRNMYPSHVELALHDRSVQPRPSNIFSITPVPTKFSSLPALPFLVPAVIEALSQSSFGEITYVVPGEADTFCAQYVKTHGGTILTSDSDLLVYDLGANGGVIFFKDLESNDDLRLTGMKYNVTAIAHRLNLQSLLPLAYAIQKDHHRGFNNCLLEAKQIQSSESLEYKQFCAQYLDNTVTLPNTPETLFNTRLNLDPRVSEWLHQLTPSMDHIQQSQQHDFYLPFLIEDPNRIPAWIPGLPIRQLAYSALRPSSSDSQDVTTEHFRRGSRIAQTRIEHLPAATVSAVADTWRDVLENLDLLRMGKDYGWGVAWRVVGMYQVVRYLLDEGKAVPRKHVVDALICGDLLWMEWDFVHCSAMMQGVVYSWRILQQLLPLTGTEGEEFQTLHGLLAIMDTLPGIVELFPVEIVDMDEIGMKDISERLYDLLDMQAEEYTVLPVARQSRKHKRKKRDGKPKAKNSASSLTRTSSTNKFSLLSENG
jgi:hypothetical protein